MGWIRSIRELAIGLCSEELVRYSLLTGLAYWVGVLIQSGKCW